MRLSLVSSSITLALLALPASADNKAEAKSHVDSATAAHKEGRFDDARKELEAAYALDPQPQLLYALGQVNVKLGRCAEAITYYEQFIQTKPAQAATDAANQAIVTCRVAITQAEAQAQQKPAYEPSDAQLPPAGEDTERPLETERPAQSVTPATAPTPWYKDVLGMSLVGVGTASLAAGVVLYVHANGRLDDVEGAPTYAEARSIVDDAKRTRAISLAFTAAGAALVAGGIVYYVKRDSGRGEARAVSVTPTTSGGLVTLSGRF